MAALIDEKVRSQLHSEFSSTSGVHGLRQREINLHITGSNTVIASFIGDMTFATELAGTEKVDELYNLSTIQVF